MHAAPQQSQPVLVELFTSEGCSDCPPADELLARIDQQQFVSNAHVIVLSEHVTYWNHLGWRDPFSQSLMDERQLQYARRFSLSTIYTPQMVVDGAEEFNGSDEGTLRAAVAKEAAKPRIEVAIADARFSSKSTVSFNVHPATGAKGTLIAALAQDASVSRVSRGENAGRTLHHVAVVRVIKNFSVSSAEAHVLLLSEPPGGINLTAPLRLVVFLVDDRGGNITGAAEQTLRP